MGGEIAKEKESPTKSMRGESNKLSNHECTDRSLGNEVPPIGSTDSRSLPNFGSEGLQPLESHFSLEGQAFEEIRYHTLLNLTEYQILGWRRETHHLRPTSACSRTFPRCKLPEFTELSKEAPGVSEALGASLPQAVTAGNVT